MFKVLFLYAENAFKDLRLFFFLWALLNVYRIFFLLIMQEYIGGSVDEVIKSITTGAALSLKTAGFVTLFSFVFVTLVKTLTRLFKKEPYKFFDRLRERIGFFAIFLFTLLFIGRFAYYKAFNSTYDWQIFMGINDDLGSVLNMLVVEYGLLQMILIAIIIAYILYRCFIKFLNIKMGEGLFDKITLLSKNQKIIAWILAIAFTFCFGWFCRFGAAFSYSAGVNWENAQSLEDKFLNECMLDDGQAFYRAYSQEVRMKEDEIIGIYPASINEFAGGVDIKTSEDLSKYLKKTAGGARIDRPEHIFLIVGETFAAWPLFEEYESLGVGNFIKSLSKENNAFYYEKILPNGEFTAIALNGFITGLLDTNIRINYQMRSYEKPYATALAPQIEALSYNTAFWYGGTLEWDNIGKFAKAQGFDKVYGYPEFHAVKQNTWGTTDRALFNAVFDSLENSPPTMHLIMTTSNHPPFNMSSELPIEPKIIEEKLTDYKNVVNREDLAVELAYYSYMDKEIFDFIKKTYEHHPKSLFIVTGDHSVRMLPQKKPTDTEFVTVPLLFYGYGINQDILNKDAVLMHASIMPTLMELIAPKGYEYCSIMPSAFNAGNFAVMNKYYFDGDKAKKLYKVTSSGEAAYESFRAKTISWWLMEK